MLRQGNNIPNLYFRKDNKKSDHVVENIAILINRIFNKTKEYENTKTDAIYLDGPTLDKKLD